MQHLDVNIRHKNITVYQERSPQDDPAPSGLRIWIHSMPRRRRMYTVFISRMRNPRGPDAAGGVLARRDTGERRRGPAVIEPSSQDRSGRAPGRADTRSGRRVLSNPGAWT